MGQIFITLAKRVGIFLIAGQTILHLGVGKRYEKYLRLIIALMAAAQMISGFRGIIPSVRELVNRGEFGSEEIQKAWEEEMEQFAFKLQEQEESMGLEHETGQLTEQLSDTEEGENPGETDAGIPEEIITVESSQQTISLPSESKIEINVRVGQE